LFLFFRKELLVKQRDFCALGFGSLIQIVAGDPPGFADFVRRNQVSDRNRQTQPAIHIVSPAVFDAGTAQTPGSERLAAITQQNGIDTTLWDGLFEVNAGARTWINHHGEQQTIAYVLSCVCEVRWGESGEHSALAKQGDFIHVPAFLLHMEINPSQKESFRWVVVRSTPTPIVVNVPESTWP